MAPLDRCEAWAARYDDTSFGPDDGRAVAVSPDGGRVYLTGLSESAQGPIVLTLALDAATGLPVWGSRFDGPGFSEEGHAVAVAPDGGTVFVGGNTLQATGYDYLVLALDAASGFLKWHRTYNGPGDALDRLHALAVAPDGTRLFVTGASTGPTGPGPDVGTLALDADTGALLWEARHDGPASRWDRGSALAVSPDGATVVVAGEHEDHPPRRTGLLVLALDAATGALRWATAHHGPRGDDRALAVAVAPDGERVFAAGYSAGEGLEYLTVAVDAATGNPIWAARYAGPGGGLDTASAVAVSPDGSMVVVTGGSDGAIANDDEARDYATVAYDAASGQQRWVARYDGPSGRHDKATGAAFAAEGTQVFVTGTSDSGPSLLGPFGPWRDAATVAYDAFTGAQRWEARYNGPLNQGDSAEGLALAPDGARLYVAGAARGVDGTDYLALAYDLAQPPALLGSAPSP